MSCGWPLLPRGGWPEHMLRCNRRKEEKKDSTMNLIYTPLIGLPLCLLCMMMGTILCLTVIGIPFGLTLFALGFNVVKLQR